MTEDFEQTPRRTLIQAIKEAYGFAVKFIRDPKANASLVPSSLELSNAATDPIDWSTVGAALELGPGTGPITEAILSKARPDARVFAVEFDADYVSQLEKRFKSDKRLELIHGNALDVSGLLSARGVESVDAIVSGLGIALFSAEEREVYFREIAKVLRPGGVYTQITEVVSEQAFILLFGDVYRKYFKDVTFVRVWKNLPPGGVFICKDPK